MEDGGRVLSFARASVWSALSVVSALSPAAGQAQQLLTPDDLLALDAPEPTAQVAYGPSPLQYANLRMPTGPGPHPVVVFVHGGCYLSVYDIAHARPAAQAIADAGYAVWSLEYRRVGDEGGGWPNTFLDIASGIDHLRAIADEYDLDLARVYAAGHSAGANMALWAAMRPDVPETSDVHGDDPLPIRGVLGLAPAPTLAALHGSGVCGGVIDGLMGGSPAEFPDRYAAVSPMLLPPDRTPQRLVVGSLDSSWGPGGRAYYEHVAGRQGASVTLREAPESGHFEMMSPVSSTWPLVLAELAALTGR